MTHLAALKLLMILMMQLPSPPPPTTESFSMGNPEFIFGATDDCWFAVEDIDVKIAI